MPYLQDNHTLQIETPLGDNVLLIDHFEGEEAISALFEFRLRLRSQTEPIAASEIIGQGVTVSIARTDGSGQWRYFHGIITRFENHGRIDGDFYLYTAVMRPWLWLLTQTTDCKIFQGDTALDIAEKLFKDAGNHPFEIRASPPKPREYCVQYNETDFAFISRLLEDEGIFYYFRHERGQHTLVIGDDASALAESEEASVSFKSNLSGYRNKDRLRAWAHGYEFRPGKWAHTDYNFQTPDTDLLAKGESGDLPGMPDFEIFEFPGDHQEEGVGTSRASVRADQTIFEQDSVRGQSVAEAFSAGCKFSVGDHHLEPDQGRDFVLTMVHHEANQAGSFSDSRESDSDRPVYMNWFTAVPAETKMRTARRTVRPRVWGPHTAMVVGPQGEEIHTDPFGRIKVRFYWDREGKENGAKSSCWIRTAQTASGGTYGLFSVPRVGHEVVVNFIDGDPDRPLVTGAVYNANNMPPVSAAGRPSGAPTDAVGAKMQTTLRSNSLGGSGGHNEITMNDTGGAETLFLKAQKDEYHTVGHNRDDRVTQNETRTIGVNRTDTVGINENRFVGIDQTVMIGVDQSITVGNDRTDMVGNDEDRTVGNDQTVTIGDDQTITVGDDQTESIGNDRTDSVGNDETSSVGNDRTDSVGNDEDRSVGNDRTDNVGQDESRTIGNDRTLDVVHDSDISIGNDSSLVTTGYEDITVGKDRTKTVTGDETTHIIGNLNETVDKDETLKTIGNRNRDVTLDEIVKIHGNRSETVYKDETLITIGNRTRNVTLDEKINLHGKLTQTIDHEEMLTTTGKRTRTVNNDESITISGNRTVTVTGNQTTKTADRTTTTLDDTLTVNGARIQSVSKGELLSVVGNQTLTVSESQTVQAKEIFSSGSEKVTIVCGANTIVISPDSISIEGTSISITGTASIKLACGGSSINMNPTLLTLKGTMIKIN